MRIGKGVTAFVFASGAALGFVAARNVPADDKNASMLSIKCDEFRRYCRTLEERIRTIIEDNDLEHKPLDGVADERQPGRQAPPLSVKGWLNNSRGIVDRLRGKVVVVDMWAFW